MYCESPYVSGSTAHACGRCDLCRNRLRREWAHRVELEAAAHEQNSFVTLTYDDQHLPTISTGLSTLAPEDARNWLKRFRKALTTERKPHGSANTIRFFLVGEYGDKTFRPHYHAAIFGYPGCRFGRTRLHLSTCCDCCQLVRDTWGKGRIEVGTLEAASARYVAGYVTKKMTRYDDPRLQGRMPEFSRQSNREGGLGYKIAEAAAHELVRLGLPLDDVPTTLRHGSSEKPLGRYLRRRMRSVIWGCPDAPPSTVEKAKQDLHALLKDQGIDPESIPAVARRTVIKNAVQDASAQVARNLKARRKPQRTL